MCREGFVAFLAFLVLQASASHFVSLNGDSHELGYTAVQRYMHELEKRAQNGDSVARPPHPNGPRASESGVRYVDSLVRLIHARQHPPQTECRSTRLLLIKSPEISFEGLGSVLSLITLGLAEAMYSNRTLVWGAELTPLLELSRAVWSAPNASVRGTALDCSQADKGGGAFSCLFEPISSCSLADVAPSEITALRDDGYADDARIKIMDHRRSFVAYMAPPGVPGPTPRWPNHLWYAARKCAG